MHHAMFEKKLHPIKLMEMTKDCCRCYESMKLAPYRGKYENAIFHIFKKSFSCHVASKMPCSRRDEMKDKSTYKLIIVRRLFD